MPLSEASLKKIVANDPKIHALNLSNQELTDRDVHELLDKLRLNPYITELDLSHNDIGPQGAAELASNNTLRSLKLCKGNSKIKINDLQPFLGNTSLVSFPIHGGSGELLKQIRAHISSNATRARNPIIMRIATLPLPLPAPVVQVAQIVQQPLQFQILAKSKAEKDTHEAELVILKSSYTPSKETYENLKNFDNVAQIQSALFRSAFEPLAPLNGLWFKNGDEVVLQHNTHTSPNRVSIVPFGLPGKRIDVNGENRNISYNVLFDDVIHQSYALTKEGSEPKRKMPKSLLFTVKDFGYMPDAPVGSPFAGNYHTPGHCIDHKDSPAQTSESERSTYCYKFNYIPEPPNSYWGKHIRNPIVKSIRKSGLGITKGGVYVQYPYYASNALKTVGDYSVPSGVYLAGHTYDGQIKPFGLNVRWDYDFSSYSQSIDKSKYKKAYTEFKEDISAMPFSACFDVNWTSQDIQKRVDYHQEQSMGFLKRLLPSRDPLRSFEHHLSYAAKLEFKNAKCKLDLAIHYETLSDYQIAKNYLKSAKAQTTALIDLDKHEKLISETQLTFIKDSWESRDDAMVDFWHKVFADQNGTVQVMQNPPILTQYSSSKLKSNNTSHTPNLSPIALKQKMISHGNGG